MNSDRSVLLVLSFLLLAAPARGGEYGAEERSELALAYFEVGRAYEGSGKQEKADWCFRLAIRLDPENKRFFSKRGQLKIEPDEETVAKIKKLYRRAHLWAARRDFKKTVELLEEILELDPASADAHNEIAWINSAVLGRDLSGSIHHAKLAIALATNAKARAFFLDTLGWTYYKMGAVDKGYRVLREALETYPYWEINNHVKKLQRELSKSYGVFPSEID